ncbi:peptidase S10 [Akkermansiaceae bacterium]|nr:peptidase S10 [Akkermansiaceae bacterium]MDB4639424.1 peptidase S10 [Akkermansiaceae bacterium]
MRKFIPLLLSFSLLTADEPAAKKADEAPKKKEFTVTDSVTIDGKKIDYRATASTLTLKTKDDKDRASVFSVAYERLGIKDKATRPVMFAFNGGPGSSAVWLHLGALGPKIVPTSPDGTKTLPPPSVVIPNEHSILDLVDIVFIDPVSTGYSRVEKDGKPADFHGVSGDIESVGDFIRRWTTENDRWASPKYLLGESYGGIRASGLAEHLQTKFGMNLNGVVLLSSLVDFRTLRTSQGDDLTYSVFLPAMTATSHHHGKITGDRDALVKEARAFAFGPYAQALLKGSEISNEEKNTIAAKLAAFTGLPAELFLELNLRLSSNRYRKELLRKEGKVLGRFDARTAWPVIDSSEDNAGYDPSYSVVYGAFATAMNDYLSRSLKWEGHHPYNILTGDVHPWNWGAKNSIVNMSRDLESAMRNNPDLRILVMGGYTDLATPPANMQHSLSHLFGIPKERRDAIEFTWYDAGHMFYLNEPDLIKMRADLVKFLTPASE